MRTATRRSSACTSRASCVPNVRTAGAWRTRTARRASPAFTSRIGVERVWSAGARSWGSGKKASCASHSRSASVSAASGVCFARRVGAVARAGWITHPAVLPDSSVPTGVMVLPPACPPARTVHAPRASSALQMKEAPPSAHKWWARTAGKPRAQRTTSASSCPRHSVRGRCERNADVAATSRTPVPRDSSAAISNAERHVTPRLLLPVGLGSPADSPLPRPPGTASPGERTSG